jgi:nitrous oxidase accessory protein NosD
LTKFIYDLSAFFRNQNSFKNATNRQKNHPFHTKHPFLMKALQLPYFVALAAALTLFGCKKESTTIGAATSSNPLSAIDESHYYHPDMAEITATDRSSCDWTEIPAGSVDALAAAITATCNGGVIYLKAGTHTQNSRLTISKSVKILGEAGTVLKLNSTLSPFSAAGTFPISPAIHVLNTSRVLVQGLDIQTTGPEGATALLFQNAHESAVMHCKITNFQVGIVVEKSDRMVIMRNTILGGTTWQTQAAESDGIVVVNGKSPYLAENDITNTVFGFWICDTWGTCQQNNVHDNLFGIVLCNVPMYFELPDATVTGALIPCTQWKVVNNKAKNNFDNGITVIDGANGNLIMQNEVTGNGLSPFAGTAADIEIFNDSHIFGFLTPKAYDNYIDATQYPGSTIRNCSTGNTIVGGVLMNGGCR